MELRTWERNGYTITIEGESLMNINSVEVRNVDELKKELDERLKAEWYDLEEYVKEAIKSVRELGVDHEGNGSFELSSHETKSGNPSDIHFVYTSNYDEELDQTTDETLTF